MIEAPLHSMRLIRYQPEYQEPMLALHRSAIEGFTLGIKRAVRVFMEPWRQFNSARLWMIEFAKMPNERPGPDAGWRFLLAFQRAWPRATHADS